MVFRHGVSALCKRAEKTDDRSERCAVANRIADRSADTCGIAFSHADAREQLEALAQTKTERDRSAYCDADAGFLAHTAPNGCADRAANAAAYAGAHSDAAPDITGPAASRAYANASRAGSARAVECRRSYRAIVYRGAAQRRSADRGVLFRERLARRKLHPCEYAHRQHAYGARGRWKLRCSRHALYAERKLPGNV